MNRTSEELEQCKNFNEVFEVVKHCVQKSLKRHRAGLTLILAELPNYVGAYHIMGSNIIVMNETILNAIKIFATSKAELNSFIFSILTHEYLHSIGYMDERNVRFLVRKVSTENFGKDHQTIKFALGDLFTIYPQLKSLGIGRTGKEFTIIKEFDKSSMPYIG
jgi:hypothetical protein